MRVGLDARFAAARYDGVGRYVVALTHELLRLTDAPQICAVWPDAADAPRHPLPDPSPSLLALHPHRGRAPESPWSFWEIPRLLRRARIDVWHAPFPISPVVRSAPSVVTLHDCIPERFPGYFGRRHRLLYRLAAATALRRARLIVVPSELTAADAVRFHHVPAARIRVVPLGVDPPLAADDGAGGRRRALGLGDGGYVLVVGRPRPHKGHTTLVRALARLPRQQRPTLVRVGNPDPRLPDGSEELAAEQGVELRVLRGLTDAELFAVYRGAIVVAVPSAVEGFGLPVLEALAAGVPVLASDIQPLRASGGAVARYVNGGEREWAAAVAEACEDAGWRRAVRSEGPTQAAHFSWSATAARTLEIYCEAAA